MTPFWREKRLDQMTRAEWESLCDGCARCCLHKLRDEDTNRVHHTDVACRLLDLDACRCSDYAHRKQRVPDCIRLTPTRLARIDWLPPSCAYRLVREGKDLPEWHPLVSGDPESVHRAGMSVRGRAVPEGEAGRLEDHVVRWPGTWPRGKGRATMNKPIYGGVNAAVLTPMGPDLAPDLDRMAAHGRWLLAHGCNGLGILGTTGEAASFGLNERMAIVDGLVARGIPAERMMPGTGCPSLTDTVDLTNHAAAAGCPGVLMLPPYYYKAPTEDGLFAWYSQVIERTKGRAKVYLYHFPQQSAVPITLSLIRRLLDAFPGVVKGVKDSSGDYANMKAMVDAFAGEGFEVYSGSDAFLQKILLEGGAGCITAASNANCLWGGIVYAHRTGPEADRAQAVLNATRAAASSVPLIAGLREVIARSTGDAMWRHIRPPNMPLSAEDAEKAWAGWQAAGALPLPGLSGAKAA